jgi:tRNA(fMet)-specific endonuclease VapC
MCTFAWMLDTNVLSELVREPRGATAMHLAAATPDAMCTSSIVACELRFGAQHKAAPVHVDRVHQLLDCMAVLRLDDDVDTHYADIRVALERAGTPIGSHDLFIAAQARCRDLTLVARNTREFARVPGLRIDDWGVAATT